MLEYPIRYRGIDLNSVETLPGSGLRRGSLIEEFDFSDVQGVGYTEKRAQDDGLDASDVFLGARYLRMLGYTYGDTQGDLHDRLQDIRTIFTPTIAYAENIPDYGYLPLEFSLPTENIADFPLGLRELEFHARPREQPTFSLRRDSGGGEGKMGPGGIQWRAVLECRDPRMYVRPQQWVYWSAPQTAIPLDNRGDYPAPLDILIEVPSTSIAGVVEIDVGQSQMSITIPDSTNLQVIRYSGSLKVLTLQQLPGGASPPGVETLRMDLLVFRNNTTHPTVPPEDATYTTRKSVAGVTLGANTRFMYHESFA